MRRLPLAVVATCVLVLAGCVSGRPDEVAVAAVEAEPAPAPALRVHVLSAATHAPMHGAQVWIEGAQQEPWTTDASGLVVIPLEGAADASFRLGAVSEGHVKESTTTIHVGSDRTPLESLGDGLTCAVSLGFACPEVNADVRIPRATTTATLLLAPAEYAATLAVDVPARVRYAPLEGPGATWSPQRVEIAPDQQTTRFVLAHATFGEAVLRWTNGPEATADLGLGVGCGWWEIGDHTTPSTDRAPGIGDVAVPLAWAWPGEECRGLHIGPFVETGSTGVHATVDVAFRVGAGPAQKIQIEDDAVSPRSQGSRAVVMEATDNATAEPAVPDLLEPPVYACVQTCYMPAEFAIDAPQLPLRAVLTAEWESPSAQALRIRWQPTQGSGLTREGTSPLVLEIPPECVYSDRFEAHAEPVGASMRLVDNVAFTLSLEYAVPGPTDVVSYSLDPFGCALP